jgi:two-component system response regulator YesN
MYSLLIIDDEPLVQVGMKGMLDWEELDISILGVASNGIQALEIIQTQHPDLVITDIKMPLLDGIGLIQRCNEELESPPLFIVLTSVEDFDTARQVVKLNVVDYLVKLEMDKESLKSSVQKATATLEKAAGSRSKIPGSDNGEIFLDRFLTRLLHGDFTREYDIRERISEFNLSWPENAMVWVSVARIRYPELLHESKDKEIDLFFCALNMANEMVNREIPSFFVTLDSKSFGILTPVSKEDPSIGGKLFLDILDRSVSLIEKYFNIGLRIGIGSPTSKLLGISQSYIEALDCLNLEQSGRRVIPFRHLNRGSKDNAAIFQGTWFIQKMSDACHGYDAQEIHLLWDSLIRGLQEPGINFADALDICSQLLHLLLEAIGSRQRILDDQFQDHPQGCRMVFAARTVSQLADWAIRLRSGLAIVLAEYQTSKRHPLITMLKKYLDEHFSEKIGLQETAEHFQVSPNYLSALFKKNMGVGFSDYVTNLRIRRAKEMIRTGSYKVYQVSEMLGFDNPYYFSKVFKRAVGCSPREFFSKNVE